VLESRFVRRRRGGTQIAQLKHGERGAAAVEFALVSVLLITIMLAILQFAVVFWSLTVAEHASREGARAYATDPCASHVALVTDRVGPASGGGLAISRTFSGATPPQAGDQVTVSVRFDVHRVDGGFLPFVPASVHQVATARVEDVEDC